MKSLTSTRLILVTTAVAMTTGAGVLGDSAAALDEDPGPLVIQVEVVDPEGHPLAGADVVATIWYARGSDEPESVVERTRSDAQGKVRLSVARERSGAKVQYASVWAYQAGRALATRNVPLTSGTSRPPFQLTLDQPVKWTITVHGPDDRPMAGLQITPHALRFIGRTTLLSAPAALLEPMAVITDAQGTATLPYLPASLVPLSIDVSGPGIAPHTLPLDVPVGKTIVLKLGRPGRLVGIVRSASGQPLADVPVEVWVQGSGSLPSDVGLLRGNRRITPDVKLTLDPQPLKTRPQGAFQTPPTLLGGLTYRVSIRQEGYVPFVSGWITLEGARATIPTIRLQPLQKLTGRLQDRQGRAVAGARVFVPSGGPATTTDAQGRFAIAGILPGKTFLLAERGGFRLRGWPIDPSARAELGSLTLARSGEPPEPVMKPLADPIPPEESRALANRLLDPFLREAPEPVESHLKLEAIRSLSAFDIGRALDLFQDGKFPEGDPFSQMIRGALAIEVVAKDPVEAETLVEAMVDPYQKSRYFVRLARVLPASERGRKRALLERAAAVPSDRLRQINPRARINRVALIAEQWLALGEPDRARPWLEEGKPLFDSLPPGIAGLEGFFLVQLMRLEPDQALARLQKLPVDAVSYTRDDDLTTVAAEIATERPAEAERLFQLRHGLEDRLNSHEDTLRLCRRLARVDPPRARRVAAALGGRGARACAWAFVALGLAEKGHAGAAEAIDQAIHEIDRIRESGPGPVPNLIVENVQLMYPTNPAAVILPIVERVAPDRLGEVFWRAVALHPRIASDREDRLQSSYLGFECMLLAHYDREVAAVLFEPMDSYLKALAGAKGRGPDFTPAVIVAKACLDPRAAVALLQSLPPARDPRSRTDPAHEARFRLAEVLGVPPEKRWQRLWSSMSLQLPLDD